MSAEINYPFGDADIQEPGSASGSTAISVDDTSTIIKLAGMAGAVTLDLTINPLLKKGSMMKIVVQQGATARNVTLGAGFDATAPDLVGDINDRDAISLVYNGTAFEAVTTWQKIAAVV